MLVPNEESAEQIDVGLFVFVTEVARDYTQVNFDVPVRDYVIKFVDMLLSSAIISSMVTR